MRLAYDGQAVPLLVESDAFEGVKRIAGKLAEDICKVTGCKPQILPEGQLSAEQAGGGSVCHDGKKSFAGGAGAGGTAGFIPGEG